MEWKLDIVRTWRKTTHWPTEVWWPLSGSKSDPTKEKEAHLKSLWHSRQGLISFIHLQQVGEWITASSYRDRNILLHTKNKTKPPHPTLILNAPWIVNKFLAESIWFSFQGKDLPFPFPPSPSSQTSGCLVLTQSKQSLLGRCTPLAPWRESLQIRQILRLS
jgi:hypothetical protein